MNVDYNRLQTRVGMGLVKTKNTLLGFKKEGRGTYITPEKGGDIWILRKCMYMYVPVFWRTEKIKTVAAGCNQGGRYATGERGEGLW